MEQPQNDAQPSPAQRFDRFVALGDSTTEGIDDQLPDGSYLGWADRLAALLAVENPGLLYANLAIRGRLIGQIHDTQLEPALAMKPDLVSVVGGVNDILRPRADIDLIGATMESMQRALIDAGATVLTMTLPDLSSSMGVARLVRDRLLAYNETMREVAQRTGALMLDMAQRPGATDSRFWSVDRLHANSNGHEQIALATAELLGLGAGPPTPGESEQELRSRRRQFVHEAWWIWSYLGPWIGRRLTGRSSGDGITPKRPELEPVDFAPTSGRLT